MTPLLTPEQAAGLLQVSTRTLRRLRARGALAHHTVGGSVRFTRDDIERYLRGTRQLAEPPRAATPGTVAPPGEVADFERIRRR